jgi:hypothetical protein
MLLDSSAGTAPIRWAAKASSWIRGWLPSSTATVDRGRTPAAQSRPANSSTALLKEAKSVMAPVGSGQPSSANSRTCG